MAARTKLTKEQIAFCTAYVNALAVKAKIDEHDTTLDALTGAAGAKTYDTVTSGALSVATAHTNLSVTGTVGYTLAAGTVGGQTKTIRCTTAASTPAGTITGAFLNGAVAATSLAFNAVDDYVMLQWDAADAKWVICQQVSVTIT